ncbi:MAG: OmpA family protein [Bacillota bacterium]
MKVRRRNFKRLDEAPNFWPSFTDVMSTIALVLFFLMLLAYIQNLITGSKLEFINMELDDKQRKLDSTNIELSNKENQLRLIENELEKTTAEVELGKNALTLSQQEIERQKEIIAMSNQELGNLRTKLEKIAVLRLDVLKKVKESIENEIGRINDRGESLVTIGEDANIIINESLVFGYNSYEIKNEGRKLLDQFAIAFERILDDNSIRDYIDSINIEGYTDEVGDSSYNRELSTKRSAAVVTYLMKSNPQLERKYGDYFATVGFSEFRPIASGSSEEARQKNRRIEISIAIKDSNIQKIIADYLKEADNMLNTDQGDHNEE